MPHPEREHSLQIEVARLRKLHEDTEDARCVLLAELRAANARADAAEAGLAETKLALSRMVAGTLKDQEALAAARREIEVLKTALAAAQESK